MYVDEKVCVYVRVCMYVYVENVCVFLCVCVCLYVYGNMSLRMSVILCVCVDELTNSLIQVG